MYRNGLFKETSDNDGRYRCFYTIVFGFNIIYKIGSVLQLLEYSLKNMFQYLS